MQRAWPAVLSGCRSITFGPDISSIGTGSTSSPIGTAGKTVDVAREALDDSGASITERHARFQAHRPNSKRVRRVCCPAKRPALVAS